MNILRSTSLSALFLGIALAGQGAVWAADGDADAAAAGGATPLRTDFLDAVYLPGLERVAVTGLHGLVGLLEVGADAATLRVIDERPDQDFTAIEKLSDNEALLGSSTGRIFHFDGSKVTELAAVSEYNEPILDIAADASGVWVVGARGLVAYSADGKQFENVEIRDVRMPPTTIAGGQPADWYFGVSNVHPDTVEFTASVGGAPVVVDEHFVMYPDEGFVQILQQLDAEPVPTVSFVFDPGPPFRVGDVSWNVVLVNAGKVTIAGEFGMILVSEDNGKTWTRRDSEIVPHEPEPAYWLAGVQQGDDVWLAGAAGVMKKSSDGGVTWSKVEMPGREGIFGITLLPGNKPVIAGAVGLIGILENGEWRFADRTALQLLSWLKAPITMPDGSLVVTGGRAAAIRVKDGQFVRVPVGR